MYRKLIDVNWIVTSDWYPRVRLLNWILVLVLNRISTGRLCYIFHDLVIYFPCSKSDPSNQLPQQCGFIMIYHDLSIQPVFVAKSNQEIGDTLPLRMGMKPTSCRCYCKLSWVVPKHRNTSRNKQERTHNVGLKSTKSRLTSLGFGKNHFLRQTEWYMISNLKSDQISGAIKGPFYDVFLLSPCSDQNPPCVGSKSQTVEAYDGQLR